MKEKFPAPEAEQKISVSTAWTPEERQQVEEAISKKIERLNAQELTARTADTPDDRTAGAIRRQRDDLFILRNYLSDTFSADFLEKHRQDFAEFVT